MTTHSTPLSLSDIREYEKLDGLRLQGMFKAERDCKKIKLGRLRWSPKLQEARDKVKYYRLSISRFKVRKVGARVLVRIQQRCNFNIPITLMEAHGLLSQALSEYATIKLQHSQLRATYLGDLAIACANNGDSSKAS